MALFARDGVALILTPIVIDVLRTPDFEDETKLAFVMAAELVSDTAGVPLVVTNLVNIVSAAFFKTGFGDDAPRWCRSTWWRSPPRCARCCSSSS